MLKHEAKIGGLVVNGLTGLRDGDKPIVVALGVLTGICVVYSFVFFSLNPEAVDEPVPQQLVVLVGVFLFVLFFLFTTRRPRRYWRNYPSQPSGISEHVLIIVKEQVDLTL
jgi:hypothetical protein